MSNLMSMQKQKQIAFPFTLVTLGEILSYSLQKWQDWKESENAWFTALCEEPVTNHEVLRTAAAVCVGLPAILCLAGLVLEGGAL